MPPAPQQSRIEPNDTSAVRSWVAPCVEWETGLPQPHGPRHPQNTGGILASRGGETSRPLGGFARNRLPFRTSRQPLAVSPRRRAAVRPTTQDCPLSCEKFLRRPAGSSARPTACRSGSRPDVETAVRLDHEDALLRRRPNQPAEQVEHLLAAFDVEIVGRRTEHRPGRRPSPPKSGRRIALPFALQFPPDERIADGDFGPPARGPIPRCSCESCRPSDCAVRSEWPDSAPRLIASSANAPVPAKRSMACFPRISGPIRLKIASRRRSFIGRVRRSPL